MDAQTIFVLLIFAVFVFLVYRAVKLAIQAALVAAISFSFPWIVKFFGLDIPVSADLQTGLYFAAFGLALFIAYHFLKFVASVVRILLWPVRR